MSLLLQAARQVGAYYQQKLHLGLPNHYFLNPKYMCSVPSGITYYDSELNRLGVSSLEYHPSFTTLRKHLESTGRIKTERWHNGDVVLVPFYLNNHLMEVGDKFLCPDAMKHQKELTKNYNNGLVAERI